MKAVVHQGPRDFSIRDVEPNHPGPSDVRIRVHQTGLCGTRLRWLVQRHRRYGRSPEAARAWALGTDQRNGELVERTRPRADALDGQPPRRLP